MTTRTDEVNVFIVIADYFLYTFLHRETRFDLRSRFGGKKGIMISARCVIIPNYSLLDIQFFGKILWNNFALVHTYVCESAFKNLLL